MLQLSKYRLYSLYTELNQNILIWKLKSLQDKGMIGTPLSFWSHNSRRNQHFLYHIVVSCSLSLSFLVHRTQNQLTSKKKFVVRQALKYKMESMWVDVSRSNLIYNTDFYAKFFTYIFNTSLSWIFENFNTSLVFLELYVFNIS